MSLSSKSLNKFCNTRGSHTGLGEKTPRKVHFEPLLQLMAAAYYETRLHLRKLLSCSKDGVYFSNVVVATKRRTGIMFML